MRLTATLVLALTILAAPLAAGAQQAGKVWRIGLFHVGLDHVPPSLEGLRQGLRTLGYEEGRNIGLDFRNLPDEGAASVTAEEFVRGGVDLIVAFEDQTVRAAQRATSSIPIIFLHVSDPVADGFVKSLPHPGGNLTGFWEFYGELQVKRMELLKAFVPRLRRLLVLFASDDPTTDRQLLEFRKASVPLNLHVLERKVTSREDIERVFDSLKPGEVQGVLIGSATLNGKFPSLILRLSMERQLPVPFQRREWVEQGALFSYGGNSTSTGREAARYVDRILKGTRPSDLPVEQITHVELVINVKTAKALGLTIPPSLLLRADEVIQ